MVVASRRSGRGPQRRGRPCGSVSARRRSGARLRTPRLVSRAGAGGAATQPRRRCHRPCYPQTGSGCPRRRGSGPAYFMPGWLRRSRTRARKRSFSTCSLPKSATPSKTEHLRPRCIVRAESCCFKICNGERSRHRPKETAKTLGKSTRLSIRQRRSTTRRSRLQPFLCRRTPRSSQAFGHSSAVPICRRCRPWRSSSRHRTLQRIGSPSSRKASLPKDHKRLQKKRRRGKTRRRGRTGESSNR